MTREEIYILLGRIERLVADLKVCEEHNLEPYFAPDDDAKYCGEYAEKICAYIRATGDEQAMIDCCKINRGTLYRFANNTDVGQAIRTARRCLWAIHNIALSKIWGISKAEIEDCSYFIDSVEGVCKSNTTGEILPRPTYTAKEPQPQPPTDTPEAVPDCLKTPEALKYITQARELGLIDDDYNWLKTLQLLACFAREMSLKLGLGKGTNSDGSMSIGDRRQG